MKVYQDEAVGVVYDHAVFLSKLSSMKQVGMCGKEVFVGNYACMEFSSACSCTQQRTLSNFFFFGYYFYCCAGWILHGGWSKT
jgi:hypothetical protein